MEPGWAWQLVLPFLGASPDPQRGAAFRDFAVTWDRGTGWVSLAGGKWGQECFKLLTGSFHPWALESLAPAADVFPPRLLALQVSPPPPATCDLRARSSPRTERHPSPSRAGWVGWPRGWGRALRLRASCGRRQSPERRSRREGTAGWLGAAGRRRTGHAQWHGRLGGPRAAPGSARRRRRRRRERAGGRRPRLVCVGAGLGWVTRSAGAMSDFDSNPFADPDLNNPFKVSTAPRPRARAGRRGGRGGPAGRVSAGSVAGLATSPEGRTGPRSRRPRSRVGAEPGGSGAGQVWPARRGGGPEAGAPGSGVVMGTRRRCCVPVTAEVCGREARCTGAAIKR